MYALPAPPPPAPQRQVLVGVSLAVMAAVMMTGSMLAVWALQRREAIDFAGSWLPDGVTIPEGSVVMLRFASGNRDERFYGAQVEEIDLDRKHPRRHLAFGVGSHHCLGAPLARRELYYGFKALVDRVEELWFLDGKNDFSHHQNFFMRALKEVHVGFKPVENWKKSVAIRSEDTRE